MFLNFPHSIFHSTTTSMGQLCSSQLPLHSPQLIKLPSSHSWQYCTAIFTITHNKWWPSPSQSSHSYITLAIAGHHTLSLLSRRNSHILSFFLQHRTLHRVSHPLPRNLHTLRSRHRNRNHPNLLSHLHAIPHNVFPTYLHNRSAIPL